MNSPRDAARAVHVCDVERLFAAKLDRIEQDLADLIAIREHPRVPDGVIHVEVTLLVLVPGQIDDALDQFVEPEAVLVRCAGARERQKVRDDALEARDLAKLDVDEAVV